MSKTVLMDAQRLNYGCCDWPISYSVQVRFWRVCLRCKHRTKGRCK